MRTTTPEFDDTIRLRLGGVGFNWKVVTTVLVILFGGGGIAAWDLATMDDVAESIQSHELAERALEDIRHIRLDQVVAQQGQDIGDIKVKVDDIQSVQHKQIARQEARRITSDIKNREKREAEYDRVLLLNLGRLRQGRDPCATLACTN